MSDKEIDTSRIEAGDWVQIANGDWYEVEHGFKRFVFVKNTNGAIYPSLITAHRTAEGHENETKTGKELSQEWLTEEEFDEHIAQWHGFAQTVRLRRLSNHLTAKYGNPADLVSKAEVARALGAAWNYINGFEERALAAIGITPDMAKEGE